MSGWQGSLILVSNSVYEKENFEFKPVKLRLKTDLVSHSAHAEGLINISALGAVKKAGGHIGGNVVETIVR